MKIWKKVRNKVAIAGLFALLVFSLGFISAAPGVVVASQMNVLGTVALDTTGIDVGNTTNQMMTLFITLITVMIPLIIIMAYLGIFQDFIGAIGRAFGGLFGRH